SRRGSRRSSPTSPASGSAGAKSKLRWCAPRPSGPRSSRTGSGPTSTRRSRCRPASARRRRRRRRCTATSRPGKPATTARGRGAGGGGAGGGGGATAPRHDFFVHGKDAVVWDQDQRRVDVVPDKQSYRPGETATLLLRSPFDAARGLLLIEREGIVEHRPLAV